MDRKQQFYEVAFKDEETAKSLLEKSPEEVSAYMKTQGYEYSVEEIKAIGAELKAMADKQAEGELDEDALEDVAGGLVISTTTAIAVAAGISAAYICWQNRCRWR